MLHLMPAILSGFVDWSTKELIITTLQWEYRSALNAPGCHKVITSRPACEKSFRTFISS